MVSKTLALGSGTLILLLAIAGASYFTKRWIGHEEDYMIASREISWPMLTAGVLAFGFASDIAVIFAIFAMVTGFWTSVWLGIVYVSWMVYGLIMTKFVRFVGTQTITEWYEIRFNYPTRAVISVTQILSVIFIVAAGTLGTAQILNGYGGWPIRPAIVLMLGIILFVVLAGGMWGVTISDAIQTLFGLIIFPVLLAYAMIVFGGLGWVESQLPAQAVGFAFPGGWQILGLGENSYLTWGVLWFVALVFGSSVYWTRAATARNVNAAKNGFLGAGILGLLLMTIVMPLLGIYAFAVAPGAYTPFGGQVPPGGAFGVLANALGALGALIPIGFIAASISTYTSSVIGGTAMVLGDFYRRFFDPTGTPEELLLPSRVVSLVVVIGAFFATYIGNVTALVSLFLTMLVISSVVVLLDQYWKVLTPTSAAMATGVAAIVTLYWAFSDFGSQSGVHEVWIAIALTLGIGIVGGLVTPKKYYSENGWSLEPRETGEGSPADLSDDELQLLEAIKLGGDRFADMLDTLQIDSHLVNEYVERLDQDRYIRRNGWTGHEFYTFSLTEKGEQTLRESEFAPEENVLWHHRLDRETYEALRTISDNPGTVAENVAEELGVQASHSIGLVQKLLRLGYVDGSGLYRQKLSVSDSGQSVIADVAEANSGDD